MLTISSVDKLLYFFVTGIVWST